MIKAILNLSYKQLFPKSSPLLSVVREGYSHVRSLQSPRVAQGNVTPFGPAGNRLVVSSCVFIPNTT